MKEEIEVEFELSLLRIIADTALSGYIKDKKESLPNQALPKSPIQKLSELEENAIFYDSGYARLRFHCT